MRARAEILPVMVALSVAAVVLLGGCSAGQHTAASASNVSRHSPVPAPTLGGPSSGRHRPPTVPMDRLEEPVADQLAHRIARQGLTLSYLDCPQWRGKVPSRMTCRGYVDGLVAKVRVLLRAAVQGKAVGFDARLEDGVIATRNLESTLRRQGWRDADCGDVAAYPARVGSKIVCRVVRTGVKRYVVATVRSRAGSVMIADYRGPSSLR